MIPCHQHVTVIVVIHSCVNNNYAWLWKIKILIKILRKEKRYRAKTLPKNLNRNWPVKAVVFEIIICRIRSVNRKLLGWKIYILVVYFKCGCSHSTVANECDKLQSV